MTDVNNFAVWSRESFRSSAESHNGHLDFTSCEYERSILHSTKADIAKGHGKSYIKITTSTGGPSFGVVC